jgi:hypothetical protein
MGIEFLGRLQKEIVEQVKTATWDHDDVSKVAPWPPPPPPGGQPAPPGGGKPPHRIGKKPKYPLQPSQPQSPQPPGKDKSKDKSGGEQGPPGSKKGGELTKGKGKDFEDKGKAGEKPVGGKEGESTKGKEKIETGKSSDKNDGKQWMDDHSKLAESDGSAKGLIDRAYREVEADMKKIEARSTMAGKEAGGFFARLKEFMKEEFDLSQILDRLREYKIEINKHIKKRDTYQAGAFNPVTHSGNILAPGSPKLPIYEKNAAILIFALDTSGSITADDWSSALGYMNSIARQFEEQEHGIKGKVYYINWDTEVHPPIRKWQYMTELKPKKEMTPEEREQMAVMGMGGTDIQSLFDFLDEQFVRMYEGKPYFVWSEKMAPFITDPKERSKAAKDKTLPDDAIQVEIEPPDPKNYKYRVGEYKKEMSDRAKQGELKIDVGGLQPVPYLLIYTDGFFSKPNIANSKLFSREPGNILYIVTSRAGIANINPPNYVYHNLHNDKL